MSSIKAALKAAKTAFDDGRYNEAISKSEEVLQNDAKNYNAKLLLGRAQEKKSLTTEAEATYRSAASLRPDDFQAWSGLCSVFSTTEKIDDYIDATEHLANIFARAEDKERCSTAINKLIDFVRKHGNPRQMRKALSLSLPDNPLYETLDGFVPSPTHTYTRIVESLESEEKAEIAQQISQRRTRLGAKLHEVSLEVKREVYERSELEELYRKLISWLTDDELRHEYEEKLLQHKYDHLLVSPAADRLNEILDIAEGMVIIHHPFQLAWDLVLESRDVENLQELDAGVLQEYIEFFPGSGLSRILNAWLHSDLSPFMLDDKVQLSSEDRLLMVTDGLSSYTKPLAYRISSEYYLSLDEFETSSQTARDGVKSLQKQSSQLGLSLQNTRDAINSVLGTALVSYQAPRHHSEARRLFEDILKRKPSSTPALIGLGLIFEEMQEYQNAINFLQQVLEQGHDVRIVVELAWCKALDQDYATAQGELEDALPDITADDPKSRNLRAQCLYRIGRCIWEQSTAKERKDRDRAYAKFIAAIKSDVEYAPAYTSLGHYYKNIKDKKRARQCFQKAFELSPAEVDAAEQLAQAFADQGDWEIVEVVAQRVIDSGRARPPPGSKRKGLSWPYSALGVVQMNKLEYQLAIVSFLAALRISPEDYQSYVGLGESYHNSGRYNSAARTFQHALSLPTAHETWFARYMLANVHRELGEFDEAIKGLQEVLAERSTEFGVLLSLLQTYNEKAWQCSRLALFGQATEAATHALETALSISKTHSEAFNLWKGVGDACMVFCTIQARLDTFPGKCINDLLGTDDAKYETFGNDDDIRLSNFTNSNNIHTAVSAGILAYKRAVSACSTDRHAQAVAWYNLGWAEQRASMLLNSKNLRTAVKCFKKAIELEAGNAEFWNALGIVTTTLNPSVAQHSFVRSLHINELNAKVWTNLGVLYLLQNDFELAQQAFGRAQSTDPEYAHAWVGMGLISLMSGQSVEALNHFTHAFEISDSGSIITKMHYATSSFDMLPASDDLASLIQPLFALEQLRMQVSDELPFEHLAALFLERVSSYSEAIERLSHLCTIAEEEYERSETMTALARFAHAKTDLARCQLAQGDHKHAAENAETGLDLSDGECGLEADARQRLRLSCHLTAGLAHNLLGHPSEAISMFRTALVESNSDPDVVCLLVQVLWAHGGAAEKTAARDQLFECVEEHSEHVGSVTLLGAIAALDAEKDTMEAVKDDLLGLRTLDSLSLAASEKIESVLSAFAVLDGRSQDAAQAAIMLNPTSTIAWKELAELAGDESAAQMALLSTQRVVPPGGNVDATSLSQAFSTCSNVADSQRAILLAPWNADAWTTFATCLQTSS